MNVVSDSPHKKARLSKNDDVIMIVLTGGPCGGKSTAIHLLKSYLTELGYLVYTVPEVPTILFTNGAVYPGEDSSRREELLALESTIIRLQMSMEDSFVNIAKGTRRKCVLLCDRGVLDCKAYMPPDVWNEVINIINVPESKLLSRYVGICHLVTAADGAEEHYTIDNNIARTETAETAKELDKKTTTTWNSHPVHAVITNKDKTFKEKLEATKKFVLEQVEANIGKPE